MEVRALWIYLLWSWWFRYQKGNIYQMSKFRCNYLLYLSTAYLVVFSNSIKQSIHLIILTEQSKHKTVSVVQKTFNILAAELCDWSQSSGHRAIIGGHLTISFVCFWSWYLGTSAQEDKKLTWNYVQRDKCSPAWVGWAQTRQARDPAHCHCTCPVSTLFGHTNYQKGTKTA